LWRYIICGSLEDGVGLTSDHSGNEEIKGGHDKSLYILRSFEGTDEVKFFQTWMGCTKGHNWKLFKKSVNLDAGKYSFGNRVWDEWNKLPGWVVNMESMNNLKGNLDHYPLDNDPNFIIYVNLVLVRTVCVKEE